MSPLSVLCVYLFVVLSLPKVVGFERDGVDVALLMTLRKPS